MTMIDARAADAAIALQGTLLYIEDEPTNVALVEAALLAHPGVRLVHAGTGAEGIRLVRAERPDFVLLDMHLPDMSGLEVVRQLNTEIAARGLRVTILTGDSLSMDIIKAMSLGAYEYWVKPLAGRSCCPSCKVAWAWACRRTAWPAAWRRWARSARSRSVDLRRHHPDLMDRTAATCAPGDEAPRQAINDANLEALGARSGRARRSPAGRGLLAVNVMRAVSEYAAAVTSALEAGVDAVVVGAGLPLDLPDLAPTTPAAAGAHPVRCARRALVVKKWERKKAAARRHRHRASAAGRRPPGRGAVADLATRASTSRT
jgi:two-component system cell cycle response regulator DivK